ncbi:MAG: TonB-dependent receptor [Bacteroidota bacterium]|nr:TonB-dependent receptor [Bacteroidota bacterium]
MRKLVTLFLCFCMIATQIRAQNPTVTGKVTDAEGRPLFGASIKVSGNKTAALTAADGSFSITVPSGTRSILVSFVGQEDITVPLTGKPLSITMKPDSRDLNEVVVVGYGTKLKRDVTGSVAAVSAKEISNTPATSFESAIQGRAAGVAVSQQNGKLGQGINIRIRGASSVTAGNEPLYVVDGIPVTSDNLSGNGAPTNALADLNMNDIENIQILKDASSTAIYGASASNGVVLITTKKGKAGTSKIDFNYYTGLQKPTGKREFLNATQYVDYFKQAAMGAANQDFINGYYPTLAAAQADYTSYVNSRFTRYAAGTTDWQTGKVNTDWQEQAFQRAPISQYDLNFSGGNDKTKFFVSGQYLDQTGIIVRNSLKRYSARFNIDHQVKDWLTIGVNLSFAKTNNYRVSNDNAFSTPIQIVALSPITPLIDPRTGLTSGALDLATGNPNTNFPVYYNPLLSVLDGKYTTYVNRTFGTTYGKVTFSKNLFFRTEFGVDQLNQVEESYYGKLTSRNVGVPNGTGSYVTTQVLNLTSNNYFNYKKSFGANHDVDALLGMSYTSRQYDFSSASGEQFPSDSYQKLVNAASKTDASSSSTSSTLLSYFSRIGYKYKNRYLLNLTGRIDGSSRFGANHKYGTFLGVSAAWILSDEAFLSNVKWLNTLKLKVGYAGNGNDRIGDFSARGLYSGNAAYGGLAGQHPTQLANPDLKWELTYGTDIGLEAAIFNNRITIELDYYNKETSDLLLNKEIPGTSGFSIQTQNVGKLKNTGIEFSINTVNVRTKNFSWNTNFNISANRNKITFLNGQLLGGGVNKAKEGEPLGVFYAREFAGADPANGDALYYKNTVKADGTLDRSTTNDYNAAQDVKIGDPNPKFIYGFSNSFSYKGIDLDVLLQGVSGNQIYNGGGQYMSASGSNGFDNQTTDQLAAWKKPGDITMVPEARLFYANGVDPSSRFISDGSYLRVKAVTLGYNLPANLLRKFKIEKMRVYVRAQNLFTITKYKGWDPEVNADYQASNINQGVDFYSAPQLKTIVFGVSIGL